MCVFISYFQLVLEIPRKTNIVQKINPMHRLWNVPLTNKKKLGKGTRWGVGWVCVFEGMRDINVVYCYIREMTNSRS